MKLIMATGLALAIGIGAAAAQSSGKSTAPAPAMKLTQAECQQVWGKIDASKSGAASQAQAQAYVTDFKQADANADGRLSSTEFLSACDKGLVHSSASTGAGSGADTAPSMPKK